MKLTKKEQLKKAFRDILEYFIIDNQFTSEKSMDILVACLLKEVILRVKL